MTTVEIPSIKILNMTNYYIDIRVSGLEHHDVDVGWLDPTEMFAHGPSDDRGGPKDGGVTKVSDRTWPRGREYFPPEDLGLSLLYYEKKDGPVLSIRVFDLDLTDRESLKDDENVAVVLYDDYSVMSARHGDIVDLVPRAR